MSLAPMPDNVVDVEIVLDFADMRRDLELLYGIVIVRHATLRSWPAWVPLPTAKQLVAFHDEVQLEHRDSEARKRAMDLQKRYRIIHGCVERTSDSVVHYNLLDGFVPRAIEAGLLAFELWMDRTHHCNAIALELMSGENGRHPVSVDARDRHSPTLTDTRPVS